MEIFGKIREKISRHYWIIPVLQLLIGVVSVMAYQCIAQCHYYVLLFVFSFLSVMCFLLAITETVMFFAEKKFKKAILLLISELIAISLSFFLFVFLPMAMNLDL